MMGLIASALLATLTDTSGRVPSSFLEIATYFTFQANVIAMATWGALVFYAVQRQRRGDASPRWLEYARAFTAANLVAIGAIYWIAIAPLGLQDGPQLIYVMVVSHLVTPLYAAVEHMLVGSRTPLPWRHVWWLTTYATVWVCIAVLRSLLGGTAVYDYLDTALGFTAIVTGLAWNYAILFGASMGAMRIRRWRRWSETGTRLTPRQGVSTPPLDEGTRLSAPTLHR